MKLVLNEVQLIQNPALGAHLLHEFALGFSPPSKEPIGIPMPLLFLVLPLVMHEHTCAIILSTQSNSGMRLFQHKFQTKKEKDRLLDFQLRAIETRPLSLRSLGVAISCGLLALATETGHVWAVSSKGYKSPSKAVENLGKAANRLGNWCGNLPLHEITTLLRVDL